MRRIGAIVVAVLFLVGCGKTEGEKKSNNDLTLLWRDHADSCYEVGDYEQSLKWIDLYLSSDSLNGKYHFMRAYCKSQLDEFHESAIEYFIAAQLGHRPADSYYNLATCHIALGNDSLAFVYLNYAKELDPTSEDIQALLRTFGN